MVTILEPQVSAATPSQGSDRSFGFVFAVVFTIVGLWPLLRQDTPRWWAIAIALAFALVALVRPALLHPLNRAWLLVGRLLHKVVSPLVMSAIFFSSSPRSPGSCDGAARTCYRCADGLTLRATGSRASRTRRRSKP